MLPFLCVAAAILSLLLFRVYSAPQRRALRHTERHALPDDAMSRKARATSLTDEARARWLELVSFDGEPSEEHQALIIERLKSVDASSYELVELLYGSEHVELWSLPWLREHLLEALAELERGTAHHPPSHVVMGLRGESFSNEPPEIDRRVRHIILEWLTDECLRGTSFATDISYAFRRKVVLEFAPQRFSEDFLASCARDSEIAHVAMWLRELPKSPSSSWLPALFERVIRSDSLHDADRGAGLRVLKVLCEHECAAAHVELIDRGAALMLHDSPGVFDDWFVQRCFEEAMDAYVQSVVKHQRVVQGMRMLVELCESAGKKRAKYYIKPRDKLGKMASEQGMAGQMSVVSFDEHAGALSLDEPMED